MNIKKQSRLFYLGFGLILVMLSTRSLAEPLLNGLAIHHDLGKERFIAGLYADTLTNSAESLFNNSETRRMEMRIVTKRYSTRRLNSMWIEGMAVNNPSTALTAQAENMVTFANILRVKLIAGDILTIDSIPGQGTTVSVNSVELGQINDENFFNMLLRTWVGPVPLSSEFRTALLSGGEADNSLLERYESIKPTAERIGAVKIWNKPAAENDIASQPTLNTADTRQKPIERTTVTSPSISDTASNTPSPVKPSIEASGSITSVPTGPAPEVTAPQLPQSEQTTLDSIASNSTPSVTEKPVTSNTQTTQATQPVPDTNKKPENDPIAQDLDDEFLDEEDLEEDLPVLTAESLLGRQLYHSSLMKWTYKYLRYPQRARKRGQEGSVRLSVVIDRNGNVKAVETVQKSRYALLNKEAAGAIKRADPFPPMPDNVKGDEFSFSLPIVFRIQ